MEKHWYLLKTLGLTSLLAVTSMTSYSIESGSATIDGTGTTVNASTYTDPVLIAGVASRNDSDPGVVSVVKDINGDFLVRFREWDYLDGTHASETVPYLILEKGNTTLTDGTVVEAGVFSLGASSVNVFFNQQFSHAPLVFLSPQSENDSSTFSLRVEGVTQFSFTASLEEQELNGSSGHTSENIAYLAIYSPANMGDLNTGLAYLTAQALVDDQPTSVSDGQLFLEEEQSLDSELVHVDEVVSVLQTADGFFAQTTTIYGGNTESVALAYVPTNTYESCKAILDFDPSAQSGYYTLDLDGFGGMGSFSTYCDMAFSGGGWTLVSVTRGTTRIETANIVDFNSDQHLPDNVWQALKAISSEIYISGASSGNYAIAPFSNIASGVCKPLQNSLSATRLFHVETSGCGASGSDYSMLGESSAYDGIYSIWNHKTSVYTSYNFTGYGSQVLNIYVR